MHYNEIRARMSALKDEEGGEKMAEDIFARMRREGREEGREEGRAEGQNFAISTIIKNGLSTPESIAMAFDISISEVERIAKGL